MRKLSKVEKMTAPCKLYIVTGYEKENANRKPQYAEATDGEFLAEVRSFGGTETIVNGQIKIIDTIEVTCTYRPDIKYQSIIELLDTGEKYEVISKPENVSMRYVELKFKCQAVV